MYQNEGYFSAAKIAFSLESGMSSTDTLSITWPFQWVTGALEAGSQLKK